MSFDTTFSTLSLEKQSHVLKDFASLFRGNERGYGVGEFRDARQREEDNKWTPGHVRWVWGAPGQEQIAAHLKGELLTGIGVLCDDGKCWFACLDIDEYDEMDYKDVMQKIQATTLPLVVFRTKSGGLRICIFFSELIEATEVIPRMRKLAAILGYAGCEVFPKQTSLRVEKDDCPSWIYLPYGGTREIFAEQGAMNEGGNLMDIGEAVTYCMNRRLNRLNFFNLFAAEKAAETNGRRNGKKHPAGLWVEESTKEDTINAMFWDGPVCTWILARKGVGQGHRNNFLAHCATFLKKKYENWSAAIDWVNVNVLVPVGDLETLSNLKKRWNGHAYEYQCHDEPMATFCDAHGCRLKRYGVGSDGGIDYPELGMTIINTEPPTYMINAGEHRIDMSPAEIYGIRTFQIKFLEKRARMPTNLKQATHVNWINSLMDTATVVEPTHIMRANANELELLTSYFARYVPIWIRRGVPDDKSDAIRVKEEERRIYFKWEKLAEYLRRAYKDSDVKSMRKFIDAKGQYHLSDRGHWWRCTWSLSFDIFDEDDVSRWLHPD
jgi:hypothetical protein